MTYALLSSLFIQCHQCFLSYFFFFNDTATTEIYTLSLHDALPISTGPGLRQWQRVDGWGLQRDFARLRESEEHTSELQSHVNLVCRLLLEKKKNNSLIIISPLFYMLV